MIARVNPFRPGSPVNPGMFVGRIPEVKALEAALISTRAGNPTHFMLTGERGIGKTSLLLYLRYVATGRILVEGQKFSFLVIDADIDQSTTRLGLIKRIDLSLRRELGESEPARKFLSDAWDFLKRVEIAESRLRDKEIASGEEILMDEFAHSFANTAIRLCSKGAEDAMFSARYGGVLLLIDEADNSAKELGIGSFFKLLVERLQREACDHITIGLAGLPELRNVLHQSHPSALRIFDEIQLERLSREEVSQVIDLCLKRTAEGGQPQVTIDEDARKDLISLSEGYPHFIQQFGYSAFAKDTDDRIDKQDVNRGSFAERGALEKIGDGYYRNDFYNKIQKESYRQVLRIMAKKLDAWTTRADIQKQFKGNKSTLNNAIKALRDRHIILSKEGERGIYRLQHKGFALWIALYTQTPGEVAA
jgi:hypothetical protein